jgi:hypothetical protein
MFAALPRNVQKLELIESACETAGNEISARVRYWAAEVAAPDLSKRGTHDDWLCAASAPRSSAREARFQLPGWMREPMLSPRCHPPQSHEAQVIPAGKDAQGHR